MVIDTAALLAILQDDRERRRFNEAIDAADSRRMSRKIGQKNRGQTTFSAENVVCPLFTLGSESRRIGYPP